MGRVEINCDTEILKFDELFIALFKFQFYLFLILPLFSNLSIIFPVFHFFPHIFINFFSFFYRLEKETCKFLSNFCILSYILPFTEKTKIEWNVAQLEQRRKITTISLFFPSYRPLSSIIQSFTIELECRDGKRTFHFFFFWLFSPIFHKSRSIWNW